MRAELVNIAEMAMIGTTGSAPTMGTSTSGISARCHSPQFRPRAEKAARPTMSASCSSDYFREEGHVQPEIFAGFGRLT